MPLSPLPEILELPSTELEHEPAWHVVVLNDPVNLMNYVVMVFRKVLGYDEATATKHMLEVHEEGRSVVWTGIVASRIHCLSIAALASANHFGKDDEFVCGRIQKSPAITSDFGMFSDCGYESCTDFPWGWKGRFGRVMEKKSEDDTNRTGIFFFFFQIQNLLRSCRVWEKEADFISAIIEFVCFAITNWIFFMGNWNRIFLWKNPIRLSPLFGFINSAEVQEGLLQHLSKRSASSENQIASHGNTPVSADNANIFWSVPLKRF